MNSRLEGEGGDDLGLGLGQIDEAPFDLAVLVVSAGELAEELRVPTLRLCQPRVGTAGSDGSSTWADRSTNRSWERASMRPNKRSRSMSRPWLGRARARSFCA